MYFVKSPILLCRLYQRNEIWSIEHSEKTIYLTFDDGPHPQITPWVLDILEAYGAHATFFCVGENVLKSPDIFNDILARGHAVGNHTYDHLNGWKCTNEEYFESIARCSELVPSTLFRPPYGRIRRSQMNELKPYYTVFFWSLLTGDFDSNIGQKKCFNNAVKHTREGSIVVFHDSRKAWPNLSEALPAYLEHFKMLGFEFKVIPYGIKAYKMAGQLYEKDKN